MDVPAYGSIGVAAYWVPPPLPTIIAVWISLFPLILHLAGTQDDHRMVGELALCGRFQTGIFPRLGLYDGIARLLRDGPDFLDQVSSQGTLGCTVWDVRFGSVFPCANAAAREILTTFLKKSRPTVVNIEQWLRDRERLPAIAPARPNAEQTSTTERLRTTGYRRWQTLHMIQCHKNGGKPSVPDRLQTFLLSFTADAIYMLVCLGLAAPLCLSSAFGTAAIVFAGGLSRLMCRILPIERPSGFPISNENLDHEGCMLTAIHVNASTWYLYQGERGAIDWLLNKTTISLRPGGRYLYFYFKGAHYFQLVAMTYVASQQGWDGVCLLSLMIVLWLWQLAFETNQAAVEWLKQCEIKCSIASIKLTGRTPLLGAIQSLQNEWCAANGKVTNSAWMNSILVPTPRRDAWISELLEKVTHSNPSEDISTLSEWDQQWVRNNTRWTEEAVACIKAHLVTPVGLELSSKGARP